MLKRLTAKVTHDLEAESLYVRLGRPGRKVARTIDAMVNLDVDENGALVGIELLDVPVSSEAET